MSFFKKFQKSTPYFRANRRENFLAEKHSFLSWKRSKICDFLLKFLIQCNNQRRRQIFLLKNAFYMLKMLRKWWTFGLKNVKFGTVCWKMEKFGQFCWKTSVEIKSSAAGEKFFDKRLFLSWKYSENYNFYIEKMENFWTFLMKK